MTVPILWFYIFCLFWISFHSLTVYAVISWPVIIKELFTISSLLSLQTYHLKDTTLKLGFQFWFTVLALLWILPNFQCYFSEERFNFSHFSSCFHSKYFHKWSKGAQLWNLLIYFFELSILFECQLSPADTGTSLSFSPQILVCQWLFPLLTLGHVLYISSIIYHKEGPSIIYHLCEDIHVHTCIYVILS